MKGRTIPWSFQREHHPADTDCELEGCRTMKKTTSVVSIHPVSIKTALGNKCRQFLSKSVFGKQYLITAAHVDFGLGQTFVGSSSL